MVATHSFYTPLDSVYRGILWLSVSLSGADPLLSTLHAYFNIAGLSCGVNQLISSNMRIKRTWSELQSWAFKVKEHQS